MIWEELTTSRLLTAIEGPALMTRSVVKLEPLRVTGRVAPGEAEAGESEEREGAGRDPARISMAQTRGLRRMETNWMEKWPVVT